MPEKLNTIVRLLNKELKIHDINDYSKNGLQVRASNTINKVGLATDASMETFKVAKALGCDLVIVHHGMFWKGVKDSFGINKRRVSFLKRNHISVYAAHLPLDKSKKYGHNAYLLEILGVKPKIKFSTVGYIGYLNNPKALSVIAANLQRKLGAKCKVWNFGKNKVKKIAALSGSGRSGIPDVLKKKVDLLITGELSYADYYTAKEKRLNVILAGHYKTETSGVKAVGELLRQKYGIKTVFIDLPTGL